MAVDGGMDGVAFRGVFNMSSFYKNGIVAIQHPVVICVAQCRRQHQAEQQSELFDFYVSHSRSVLGLNIAKI